MEMKSESKDDFLLQCRSNSRAFLLPHCIYLTVLQ